MSMLRWAWGEVPRGPREGLYLGSKSTWRFGGREGTKAVGKVQLSLLRKDEGNWKKTVEFLLGVS